MGRKSKKQKERELFINLMALRYSWWNYSMGY